MNRRIFRVLAAILALWAGAAMALPRFNATAAAPDRKTAWEPNPNPFLLTEWRYIAGRITDNTGDYGFVVALSDVRIPQQIYELLVQRQDFTGNKTFVSASYSGTRVYTSNTGTYTFQDPQHPVSATWQWDEANQVYRLTVTSPELNLQNVVLRPQGALILEGGDGTISVGEARGIQVDSDYYADWTQIEIASMPKGFARVDMQGLYPHILARVSAGLESTRTARNWPGKPAQTATDYDHHWFAIAGQSGGKPVWISAWRIETQSGPLWDVTIARGSGGTWTVSSITEGNTVAAPLAVQITAGQQLPSPDGPAQGTGMAWHVTAGTSQAGDLIDLQIAVPPKQFVSNARLGEGLSWIEEGVGTTASGTVLGQPLSGVTLVVAETTFEFDLQLQYMPLVRQ